MTPPSPLSWDPLFRRVDLPFEERFYPLGFPLHLRTNAARVIEAARHSWSGCEMDLSEGPLDVRVLVSGAADDPRPPRFRSQGPLLTLVADHQHFAACDLEAGFGFAWVSASMLENLRSFRFHYLEAMVYSLLTYRRLTPVHASCIARHGQGVLFCGPPGAGKSCLAFAALRRGWAFVTDDVAYLDRRSRDTLVLGRPRFLRLKPSAASLFPELGRSVPSIALDGEKLIEVDLSRIPSAAMSQHSRARHVLFLDRRDTGPVSLSPVELPEAAERLLAEVPHYGEEIDREQVNAVKRLVAPGAHRLRYGALDDALDAIDSLLPR